jgi:hypothetical protein
VCTIRHFFCLRCALLQRRFHSLMCPHYWHWFCTRNFFNFDKARELKRLLFQGLKQQRDCRHHCIAEVESLTMRIEKPRNNAPQNEE